MSGKRGNNLPNSGAEGNVADLPDFEASRGVGRRVFQPARRDNRGGISTYIIPRTASFSDLKLKQESDFECTVMIWRTEVAPFQWTVFGFASYVPARVTSRSASYAMGSDQRRGGSSRI